MIKALNINRYKNRGKHNRAYKMEWKKYTMLKQLRRLERKKKNTRTGARKDASIK